MMISLISGWLQQVHLGCSVDVYVLSFSPDLTKHKTFRFHVLQTECGFCKFKLTLSQSDYFELYL